MFVDYAGPTVPLTDRKTGEVRGRVVFVCTLAASDHTFVDLTLSRSLSDWTGSHVRMFEFWGGVPNTVVPDNERVSRAPGVSIRSEAEPELRGSGAALRGRGGACATGQVTGQGQDRGDRPACRAPSVGSPLRNHRFFSLSEARDAIKPWVQALNEQPFQKIKGSRQSFIEELGRPGLCDGKRRGWVSGPKTIARCRLCFPCGGGGVMMPSCAWRAWSRAQSCLLARRRA